MNPHSAVTLSNIAIDQARLRDEAGADRKARRLERRHGKAGRRSLLRGLGRR